MTGKPKAKPKAANINNSGDNEIKTKIVNTNKSTKPASTKRQRNLSSPESSPIPKIPAIMSNTNAPLTIEAITSLLTQQTQSLQTSMQTLCNDIKAEFQSQIIQLNDKIDANQAIVQKQITDLQSNVEKCMEQTNGTDDDLQRMSKLNELKISGIVHTNDQNLNDIFIEIAKLTQFDLSNAINVPKLSRVFKRNKTSNTSSPTSIVIAKFVANHIRNDFYSRYLNKIAAKQPIMSENINLPVGTRIIIGENLTAKNHGIFVEASKLKKEGKLCQVFTQDGLVQVKSIRNEKATTIRSQRQLELFTVNNPPTNGQSNTSNTTTITTTATQPSEAPHQGSSSNGNNINTNKQQPMSN